jgi:hypothetical protein
MRRAGIVATLALVATGCGAMTDSPQPWPIDPSAEIRPDAMRAEPTTVRPGELVEITFPQGWGRGILYSIEARAGDGWERRYLMISNANGANPIWFTPDDDSIAVAAVGIEGPGPDRVPIPEPLDPGDYRICTANAGENVCVAIEVVA